MKKKIMTLTSILLFVLLIASPVMADMFVVDVDPPEGVGIVPSPDSNPQTLPNSGEATEEAWLEGLLGLTYNDPSISYLGKITSGFSGATPPSGTQYYILKYGNGQTPGGLGDHWAVQYDGSGPIDLAGITGLPTGIVLTDHALSHVSYFGASANAPIPAPVLLLGTGLIGLAALRRKLKS